jgi:2-keto-4-pentenoate hydratase
LDDAAPLRRTTIGGRRETSPVPETAPDQDPAGGVTRGMRALLARRDEQVAEGARQIGWKIGFNTPAIQQHFGLDSAVVGYMLDAGVTPDGTTVPVGDWTAPALEVEVAVLVGDDGRVAALAPALELVDMDVSFDDLEPVLAGNICHRGVVFGPDRTDLWPADLAGLRVTVTRDGAVVAEGGLTEDPADTVRLAQTFLAAHGAAVQPGERIICGSMIAPLLVAPGDDLAVTFGPLGSLHIAFGR